VYFSILKKIFTIKKFSMFSAPVAMALEENTLGILGMSKNLNRHILPMPLIVRTVVVLEHPEMRTNSHELFICGHWNPYRLIIHIAYIYLLWYRKRFCYSPYMLTIEYWCKLFDVATISGHKFLFTTTITLFWPLAVIIVYKYY